jgi:hypothetical protein
MRAIVNFHQNPFTGHAADTRSEYRCIPSKVKLFHFHFAQKIPYNSIQHKYKSITCLLQLLTGGDNTLLEEHAIILVEFVIFCSILGGLIMKKTQNSICKHCSQLPVNPDVQ